MCARAPELAHAVVGGQESALFLWCAERRTCSHSLAEEDRRAADSFAEIVARPALETVSKPA